MSGIYAQPVTSVARASDSLDTDLVVVRAGAYHDSVTLMLIARDVSGAEGVRSAVVVMATPLNLSLVDQQGFDVPDADELTPNDLVIAVRALGREASLRALAVIDERLSARPASEPSNDFHRPPARSVAALARMRPDLNVALLTVPGRVAGYEAAMALEAGLHVFCFSDGVDLDVEARLKLHAAERGLLFMGADCGTAILDGVGFGFANRVKPGPVGLVAASGTGAQQVTCLLDSAGVGISQLIGVGGRDLSARVGGVMSLCALDLLERDPATEIIVVVSKAPDHSVAARISERTRATGKPVVLAFPGSAWDGSLAANVQLARSLDEAAGLAAELAGSTVPAAHEQTTRPPSAGWIRGLYCGGTLCEEAMAIISSAVGKVSSNIPLSPEWRLADIHHSVGHTLIDFGEDTLTEGRPHPMIDLSLRLERLRHEAADPEVTVLLLDVVLGYGSHPDPARELCPAIQQVFDQRSDINVIVSLCGTHADPQGFNAQRTALGRAGATVTRSNAHAAALAVCAAAVGESARELR
jgi:FdrA protein